MDLIQDKRTIKEFKNITFSNFKLSVIKNKLTKSIIDGDIDSALHLCAEIICSSHYIDLWEIIILVTTCYVHIGNPKLPVYIDTRFQFFRNIINNHYVDNVNSILESRNNKEIRKLFCEIISILCLSPKKHKYNTIKIEKDHYDLTILKNRLKSTHKKYADHIIKDEDPQELYIPINELIFSLQENTMNTTDACYWIEWIFEFEKLSNKRKNKLICSKRNYMDVNEKYKKDVVWVIWDVFLNESTKKKSLHQKIIQSLLNLYCLQFKPSVKRKRRYILYFAISIFTEPIRFTTPIHKSQDTRLIEELTKNINSVYKQIKKNEIKPDSYYLLEDVIHQKEEKFNTKMNIINSINYIPTL